MDSKELRALAKMAKKTGGRRASASTGARPLPEAAPAQSAGSPVSMVSRTEAPRRIIADDDPTVANLLSLLEGGEDDAAEPAGAGFEVTGIWSPEASPREGQQTPAGAQVLAEVEGLPAPMAAPEVVVSWVVADAASPEQEGPGTGEVAAVPEAVEVPSSADDESPRGCDVPQGEAARPTAPEQGVLGRATEPLEALMPVGGWLQGLEKEEAQAAAVGLLSQMGHHLVQSLEAARRSAEREALVGRLQEELRQEKENRAKLLEQLGQYEEALREAREAVGRRDAAVARVSHEMGELQRLMEETGRREAAFRQASGGIGRQHDPPADGASASLKRKGTAEPDLAREGGPGGSATPRPYKVARVGGRSTLCIQLRVAQKGVEALERRLEEEASTSSALRQQLEDERSRSAAAEGRVAELGRSISRFGASLELPLTEATLRVAPAEAAEGPEGPGDEAGAAEAGMAGKGSGLTK